VVDGADRGLLDTSAVVDLALVAPASLPAELLVSAVTLAELAAGPHAAHDPAERATRQQRLQWVEATFDPLPFDAEAARSYGRVYAATLTAGRTPRRRLADLLIAAVAAANGLPVVTRNPSDFAGLDGVVEVIAV
jgi:predicted nucleic acid-binding protein